MDINFEALFLDKLDTLSTGVISISATDIDVASVLNNFTAEDAVNHFNVDELLNEIGLSAINKWAEENDILNKD